MRKGSGLKGSCLKKKGTERSHGNLGAAKGKEVFESSKVMKVGEVSCLSLNSGAIFFPSPFHLPPVSPLAHISLQSFHELLVRIQGFRIIGYYKKTADYLSTRVS